MHDSTAPQPPSATISIGALGPFALYGTPAAAKTTEPGTAVTLLGWTDGGLPVVIAAATPEWRADLAEAAHPTRVDDVTESGMIAAAVAS